ncbi:WXG100 family type VII secretion target [Streptomyces sp. NBC_01218]|uniref:WXG100 family type VII secretion target n=1 Tax=unclassified Streptomyces TaxID=2593676 RepID=UPI0023B918DF|nr:MULTISPECIES: WXG100 family type VII secretion target [unclassified Streptomyces]WEH39366.1 WXG100 family type VII secretion target [Streptomyces sp. AM 2-1-1]WSQ51063.1 WXG100 family type VII secretion target [Streptomyces sp. NBC_01218]
MADQKVTEHSLVQLENELSTRFDSVRGQVKALQATIDGVEGAWKGVGANAFNQKQREINDHMASIGIRLQNFQEAIKAARTISGNTEDEVKAALQGVNVVSGYTGGDTPPSSLNSF